MPEKYYKKGEKLEQLKQDIKNILNTPYYKKHLFIPEENYYDFTQRIKQPFSALAVTLYETNINNDTEEIKFKKIASACDNVIEKLEQDIKSDLVSNFYEEKLEFYDTITNTFIVQKLHNDYVKYSYELDRIRSRYSELYKELDTTNFPEYQSLIALYNDLQEGFAKTNLSSYFSTDSLEYIIHHAECIIKKIQTLLRKDIEKEVEPESWLETQKMVKIRRIIYMLKTELNLDLKS